jgi:hypothetical protein
VGVNINVSNLTLTGISSSCVPGQQEQYESQSLPAESEELVITVE